MDINDRIRKYDIRVVKDQEVDMIQAQLTGINKNWDELRKNLE